MQADRLGSSAGQTATASQGAAAFRSMAFDMNQAREPIGAEESASTGHGSATRAKEISMATHFKTFITALGLLFGAAGIGSDAHAQSRGELLYSTHCISCHTTQIHWRDKKLATDWTSLRFQVRRWQDNAALAWNEADIREVTLYLNESIYRYAQTSDSLISNTVVAPAAGARLP